MGGWVGGVGGWRVEGGWIGGWKVMGWDEWAAPPNHRNIVNRSVTTFTIHDGHEASLHLFNLIEFAVAPEALTMQQSPLSVLLLPVVKQTQNCLHVGNVRWLRRRVDDVQIRAHNLTQSSHNAALV